MEMPVLALLNMIYILFRLVSAYKEKTEVMGWWIAFFGWGIVFEITIKS